jgi:hypothetical protein
MPGAASFKNNEANKLISFSFAYATSEQCHSPPVWRTVNGITTLLIQISQGGGTS